MSLITDSKLHRLPIYDFHDIGNIAFKSFAYFQKDIGIDVFTFAEFGNCGIAYIGLLRKGLFIHSFVDQKLPEFVIGKSHLIFLLNFLVPRATKEFVAVR